MASCQELISESSAGDGNFSSTSVGWVCSILTKPPVEEGAKGVDFGPVGVFNSLGNGGSSLSTLRDMTAKIQMRVAKL